MVLMKRQIISFVRDATRHIKIDKNILEIRLEIKIRKMDVQEFKSIQLNKEDLLSYKLAIKT